MKTGTCKFCGEIRELAKAHIIPLSFYPKNENADRRTSALLIHHEAPRTTIKNGIYDPDLVCIKCEGQWDSYDSYARSFFILVSTLPIERNAEGQRFRQLDNYNRKDLKLFFLSLLWRAHATSQAAFQGINIPDQISNIKQLIQQGSSGPANKFQVWIVSVYTKNDKIGDISQVIVSPRIMNLSFGTVCEIWLFGFIAYIMISDHQFPDSAFAGTIQEGETLLLYDVAVEDTSFHEWMTAAVINEQNFHVRKKTTHSSKRKRKR